MRIRRLGWAGLEVEADDGSAAVIDLLRDTSTMEPFIGRPHTALPQPDAAGAVRLALVTHLHVDHADPGALADALAGDGVVLRPERARGEGFETIGVDGAEQGFAERGLDTRVVRPWETVAVGPFEATAVPAADGLGDPQVSWVLAAGGRRIVHCGDTLFHGWWWLSAMRHGPFDAAFLPINGPVVDFPHRRPPSPLPAAMDPEQAAVAALALGAALAVPIHYETLNRPPTYTPAERPVERFLAAAADLGVETRVLEPGESLTLAAAAAG
jgi:L-ascorbate metabolism protein UlaG (beta-lactamase superfamily)